MNIVLDLQELNLLKEVVSKHNPSLLPMINSIGQVPLSFEQRESIREAIADEFIETGVGENDEPNDRGLSLESLIDRLGHL